MVLKTGSKRSDSLISMFCFCGKNVRRPFVVCSHYLFFRTNKESSIWCQNDYAKFVCAFHVPGRVSDENRACSIPSIFLKLRICLMEGHFNMFTKSVFRNQQKLEPFKTDLLNRPLDLESGGQV